MAALAKLTDLKALLGTSESGSDALLTVLLDRASAIAEGLAGLREGFLRRTVNTVEFPYDVDPYDRMFARLGRLPVESVSSVKQLYWPGTDEQFEDEGALTEIEHYIVHPYTAKLERIGGVWFLRPRCLRVVYTAGFIDPATADPPASAIQPPADLQHGVLMQAQQLWRTKDTAGVREIQTTGGGGTISLAEAKPHPALIAACAALKRFV
jgi:hypothetical protein